MADTVIQSFLSKLGFEVDASAERKFFNSLTVAEAKAKVLADALEELAKITIESITKMAQGFEALYYQTDRIGASATNIRAFTYAVSQMGGTASGASNALERFAAKFRENRGFENFLKSAYHVSTRDAAGNLRDKVALLNEAVADIANKPSDTRLKLAEQLGLDEISLQAILRGVGRFTDEYKAKLKAAGFDPAEAAKDGAALSQVWRSLGESIEIVADKAGSAILNRMNGPLKDFTSFIDANGGKVADIISRIADAVLVLVDRFAKFLISDDGQKFVDGLTDPEKWDAFVKKLGQVVDLFTKLLDILSKASTLLGWEKSAEDWVRDVTVGKGGITNIPGSPFAGDNSEPSLAGKVWDGAKRLWNKETGGTSIGKAEQSANALAVMDELRKAGLPDEGVAGALGSAQSESRFNPRAHNDIAGGHTGLIQWDSVRWPKIAAWIKGQGGDPYDIRWQARAFVAEGRAGPGTALYDTAKTAQGFRNLETAKGDIERANLGMRLIERFGAGEEAGRAANARAWLPHVAGGGLNRDHMGGLVPMPRPAWTGGFDPSTFAHTYDAPPGLGGADNSRTLHQTQHVTIIAPSGDGSDIGREFGKFNSRTNADLIRNLGSPVQ